MKSRWFLVIPIVLLSVVCVCAQSTQFTYQGNLTAAGAPANGNHDFEFALFDSLAGGSQIGSTNVLTNVAVSDGIFSVQLNFGSQFPGANRFLEIRVRPSGGGAFTTLAPRQPVTSSPYSIRSISAENAANATSAATATNALQLGGVAANQYVLTGDPRMTDARTPLPGSTSYIQNQNGGAQVASNFNISGTGAANIFDAVTQFNLGGARILSRTGTNNLFAGASSGSANTTGLANAFFGALSGQGNTTGTSNSFFGSSAGFSNATGNDNAYFGTSAGSQNAGGSFNTFTGSFAGFGNTSGGQNTFLGSSAGDANTIGTLNTAIGRSANFGTNDLTNATAIGARAQVNTSNSIVLGSINGVNGGNADTNIGIGTTSPTTRLHVVGNTTVTGNLAVSGTLNAALPAGSSNYIQNTTSPQAESNFNISGTGTANILSANTQFNLGSDRILGASGISIGNLFAGVAAGSSITSGLNNSFFGGSAGTATTTGNANSFFGGSAGTATTTGFANSFFGRSAGFANIEGFGNAFFGQGTGQANTTGNANAFFGSAAGMNNTTGSLNSLVGVSADLGAGNLTNATAIGYRSFVTQSNSLVLGSISGVNFGTADTNVGIGTTAPTQRLHVVGNGLLTGNFTVNGTGAGVLSANVVSSTARYDLNGVKMLSANGPFVDIDFGVNVTASNTFVGERSGNVTTPDPSPTSFLGKGNTFVGADAGRNNTTGRGNSFFGLNAGRETTVAFANSFFGDRAGLSNISGSNNSYFGSLAGFQKTGSNNSIFGSGAGAIGTAGSDNAFFGVNAGGSTSGSHNTFLGRSAGGGNSGGGNNNTIVGALADVGGFALTNATAIGNRAIVSQNNSLVLGSILNINGCTASVGCDHVNVGIGTTTPTQRLSISGTGAVGIAGAPAAEIFNTTANAGWIQHVNNSGNWSLISTVGAVTRFFVTPAGNIGIGTTNPLDKLHVVGVVRVTSLGASGATSLCLNASSQIASCSSSLRYKSNVNSFTPGLDLISRLRPVSFRWKDSGADDLGLVAEEVAALEPLLTTTNAKGDVEGVKYDRIGVVLINAVRELGEQVEEQGRTINALKALLCSRNPEEEICSPKK